MRVIMLSWPYGLEECFSYWQLLLERFPDKYVWKASFVACQREVEACCSDGCDGGCSRRDVMESGAMNRQS
jgi:hypothetical protein